MTAIELHDAYQHQLGASLVPPWKPGIDPGGTRSMLQASVSLPAGDLDEPDDGRVLVWSDLHLGDWMALGSFGRPFDTIPEMDKELLDAWRREVGQDDTVLVLGDVAVPVLDGERLERVAELPGWKVLEFGNHDQNGRGGVVTDPFDDAHLALAIGGDPPLVLTHMPLEEVPEGTVNLHGHTHQHRLPGRRINVSVEQLEYRPWPLTALRRLAGHLVRGETVPGETVAEQLQMFRDQETPKVKLTA